LDSSHLAVLSFPTRRSSDLATTDVLRRRRASPEDQAVAGAVAHGAAREPMARNRRDLASGPDLLAVMPPPRSARTGTCPTRRPGDRKSTRLNSSHVKTTYAV